MLHKFQQTLTNKDDINMNNLKQTSKEIESKIENSQIQQLKDKATKTKKRLPERT